MHREVVIDIRIDQEEYKKLYAGVANQATTRARDGRTIRFPAKILQPFLTHSGVQGSFVITFDASNKFVGIDRLI